MLQPADSLIESFLTPDGSYQLSTCQDPVQQDQIPFQRHIDLRTFQQDDLVTGATMYDLDLHTVGFLDSYTMEQLDHDFVTVFEGEHWTAGTVGIQTDRSNQLGIQLDCSVGITETASVTTTTDILTGFNTASFISLACPALPLESLTLSNCFIDLTSDPAGSFSGTIASVAFSNSLTPLVAGDSEVRLLLSLFTGIDLTSITGVRLRISAPTACTFRCMAIRVFAATWKVAPVDIDTRRQMLRSTVTRDGSPNAAGPSVDFPTSTTPPSDKTDFPIMFRALPGTPNVVDVRHTTFWYTGLMNQGTNTLNVYYRATSTLPAKMSDLDGRSMSSLDGHPLPDYSPDNEPVSNAEDYFQITLNWGAATGNLILQDKSSHSYTFHPIFIPRSYYVMFTELIGTSVRCVIYAADAFGNIDFDNVICDTTEINDPDLLHDRRGRIGWYAQLVDGDAAVMNINSRYVSYGEYLSTTFESMTPVSGAQLFVESSPDLVEAAGITPGPFGGSVTLQSNGYQVSSISSQPNSGAQTNPFWVYDWENLVIEFDLLYPLGASPLQVFMISPTHNIVPLLLPVINQGHWQHYRLQPEISPQLPYQDQGRITGTYTLTFIQTGSHTTTWTINNVSVTARAFRWKMRSDGPDLLGDDGLDWVPFDVVNGVYDGTVVANRGTSLQVSGVQMFPEAIISALQVIPKYSSPGRLVWYDEALPDGGGPDAEFTVTEIS